MPRKGKELQREFSHMYFFGVFHLALRVMVQTVESCVNNPHASLFKPLNQRMSISGQYI